MTQQVNNLAEAEKPSLKARILKKALQYAEGILINWLSAITLLGFVWVVQLIWGLRLIPFSLLDAFLLAGGAVLVALIAIVLWLYFGLTHYLSERPGMALGLLAGMLLSVVIESKLMHPQNPDQHGQNPDQTQKPPTNPDILATMLSKTNKDKD